MLYTLLDSIIHASYTLLCVCTSAMVISDRSGWPLRWAMSLAERSNTIQSWRPNPFFIIALFCCFCRCCGCSRRLLLAEAVVEEAALDRCCCCSSSLEDEEEVAVIIVVLLSLSILLCSSFDHGWTIDFHL